MDGGANEGWIGGRLMGEEAIEGWIGERLMGEEANDGWRSD